MRLLLGAMLALLAVPTALASPGTIDVVAALPLEVEGERAASATDAAFLLSGDRGAVSLALDAQEGSLVRVVQRAYGYVNPTDPQLEVTYADRTERIVLDLAGGSLRLEERRAGFGLLLHEADARLDAATDGGTLHVGVLSEPRAVASQPLRDLSVRIAPADGAFLRELPAGHHQAGARAGTVSASGTFNLFLGDAVLSYQGPSGDQRVTAHFRIEQRPGSVYDPLRGSWTGPGTHTEYVQEHLEVEAHGALRLTYAGLPGILAAPELRLNLLGTVRLPAAHGTVVVGDAETHTVAGEDLEVAGHLVLRARDASPDFQRTRIAGSGDITRVEYGAAAHDYPWGTGVVVATGIAALLMAGVAWLASQGKLLPLGGGLLAGYARVHGSAVLEHAGRAQVYEMVKARPGVTLQELCADVDFGASALNHHLRVLERNTFVTRLRDGRYVRFFDRQSGRFSGERKHVVSALRNPASAAIARAIAAQPGMAQCDLAARFGVAASTVNWHVRRLAAADLVQARRDHHHTRYYPGAAWASVPDAPPLAPTAA